MIWVFHRRLWRNKKVLRQKPYRKRKKDGKWTNTGKDKGIRMILSEKVIALRKRMNWSQEELAEKLNISRQAVSKWEVGATIPDLDKILKMSELFGVSTDYLLKDEMGEMELTGGKDVPEGRIVSVEEANAYMSAAKEVCGRIATAVSLFILSPVCLLLMAAMWEDSVLEDRMSLLGLIVLLLVVAAGVAICIFNGMKLEKYKYIEEESFSLQYGVEGIVEKQKSNFEEKYRMSVVIGTILCIVGVIPLLLAAIFTENNVTLVGGVCILLFFVAGGAHLFVRAGIVKESFDKLLQCGEYTMGNKALNKKVSFFPEVYWLLVTAAYLAYSFYTGDQWHKSWIVWPVAGVLFAAVYALIREAAKKE